MISFSIVFAVLAFGADDSGIWRIV